ncbi:hypothetical protein JR316_0010244 [Psilocybe cubensis]|uniref:Uncharacterized protein n=2 Tax=Psilocybe cubensis TaxID=181762 RepID=A0ACB8GSP5_PSICU|nr:hypothetical protein JR316_0010244 [Psilocybe cubensis]KAH9478010.1 hypothetical protein JR316_0010244 [Psilocybe cubensis]
MDSDELVIKEFAGRRHLISELDATTLGFDGAPAVHHASMSTLAQVPKPSDMESIQYAEVASRLNSLVLAIFMLGMYTIVYFGTLYVCVTSKISRGRVVMSAITMLYVFAVVGLGFNWALLQWYFLKNGDTRQTVFASLYTVPRWILSVKNMFVFGMLLISDGLKIWRCFHVWNRSYRTILLPFMLYIGELGIFVAALITLFVMSAHSRPSDSMLPNNLQSSGYFLSAATSLTATILIGSRVKAVAKEGAPDSTGRFKNILEIMIQSVAVYSLAIILQAISVVIPNDGSRPQLTALQDYSSAILTPIAGIAPTIMVARVCLAADTSIIWSKSRKITTLKFQTPKGELISENKSRLSNV